MGPVDVINSSGKRTGTAFVEGKSGLNGQVNTIRIIGPTQPKGGSPGYPNGYIKYENSSHQGVDPITGRTAPQNETHFPIDK